MRRVVTELAVPQVMSVVMVRVVTPITVVTAGQKSAQPNAAMMSVVNQLILVVMVFVGLMKGVVMVKFAQPTAAETSVALTMKSVVMVNVGLRTSVVAMGQSPVIANAAMTSVALPDTPVVTIKYVASLPSVVTTGQYPAQATAAETNVAH